MWLCELLIKGGQYFFDWVVTGEQHLILFSCIEFVSLLYSDGALTPFWDKYLNCSNVFLSRAPRFKGYQQQDSQELLHYLMDSIRVEETKVRPWHMATWSLYSTNCSSFRYLWNFCWIFQVNAPPLLVPDEACRVPMLCFMFLII